MSDTKSNYQEWFDFAKRDDCLDNMVPSDLRRALNVVRKEGYEDGIKLLIGNLEIAGLRLTEDQTRIARELVNDENE